jgi:hypothetical protein
MQKNLHGTILFSDYLIWKHSVRLHGCSVSLMTFYGGQRVCLKLLIFCRRMVCIYNEHGNYCTKEMNERGRRAILTRLHVGTLFFAPWFHVLGALWCTRAIVRYDARERSCA